MGLEDPNFFEDFLDYSNVGAASYAVSDSAGNLNFNAATGSNVTVAVQVASSNYYAQI